MIKINIIAVGKLKEKFLSDGVDEYLKRLRPYAKINIVEIQEERISENPSQSEINQVLAKEGERILQKVAKNSYKIALCIEGKELSSEDFSKKISDISTNFVSEISFIIGGSFGLSNEVKKEADLKMSFGKMTLPHQLMRVVLCEQIYRAFSILNHSKYHK